MAHTFKHFETTLIIHTCHKCKTFFAMEQTIHDAAYQRAGEMNFYCPNGHGAVFKSQTQIREEEATRLERDRLKQKVAELSDEAAKSRISATLAKKQVARIKKRALAGVCPCCNRTFANVARHVASKHKGEKVEA